MTIWPAVIMTPYHVLGVRTEAEYRRRQRQQIAAGRQKFPGLEWRDPWVASARPAVFIGQGKWLVRCACGDCPSVHPAWRLACCLVCGAIYERLALPADAVAIERVLVARPDVATRNWSPEETVTDLVRENVDHGIAGPTQGERR